MLKKNYFVVIANICIDKSSACAIIITWHAVGGNLQGG